MTIKPAIELRGISKSFGPVQANKDITIRVMPGTIHGIIGENGAGKSTLINILAGLVIKTSGKVKIRNIDQILAYLSLFAISFQQILPVLQILQFD